MDADELKAVMKSLIDLSICPGCTDKVTPPVYLCTNGHCICNVCGDGSSGNCQLCDSSLSKQNNESLNQLLAAIPSECKDCLEVVKDVEEHKLWCERRTVKCPHYDCEWSGPVKELFEAHVKTHKTLPLEYPVSLPYQGRPFLDWCLYYNLDNYLVFRHVLFEPFYKRNEVKFLQEEFSIIPLKKPNANDQISITIKMKSKLDEFIWTSRIPLNIENKTASAGEAEPELVEVIEKSINIHQEYLSEFVEPPFESDADGNMVNVERTLKYEVKVIPNFPFVEKLPENFEDVSFSSFLVEQNEDTEEDILFVEKLPENFEDVSFSSFLVEQNEDTEEDIPFVEKLPENFEDVSFSSFLVEQSEDSEED